MFLTLDNYFGNTSTALATVVDTSSLDVSEFENEEDRTFLLHHGTEIMTIDAKATSAKTHINKVIDDQAAQAKGLHIYEIQERFRNDESLKGQLLRYWHTLNFWHHGMEAMGLTKPENSTDLSAAFRWANCHRASIEMQDKLKGELPSEEIKELSQSISQTGLAKLFTALSEPDRQEFYNELKEGKTYTHAEIVQLVTAPEKKLAKAEEMLDKAIIKRDEIAEAHQAAEVKSELCIQKRQADRNVTRYEETIESLKAEIEAKALEVDRKNAELQKFKHDSVTQRQERIKVLTDALTVGLPQTTADINKFIADSQYYPSDIRRHFDEQIKILADMCGDHLSRI